ncbi:MAG: Bifunctional hemolysin/adenylate cyclase precursor, partial [Bacteroidota bacterium]
CAAVVWAQPLNHRWAKSLGGSTDDEAQAITVTADGTVYVAGSFTSSSMVFGPTMNDIYYNEGGYDGYIARYNPDGSLRWAACVLGAGNQVMRSLAFDTATGYLYVTGATNATVAPTYSRIGVWASAVPVTAGGSDILVMKIDTGTGALNSAVSFGGTGDDEPQALALGNGNVYIAGSFSGTVNFCGSSSTCTPANVYQRSSAGGTDAFVLRLSAATLGTTGVVTYGSTGADMARDVTADNAGNFYAVGNFSGSVNFNPLYNAMNRTSAGGYDGFVLKANSNLGTLWVVSQGNTGSDWGSAVALDKDGDVYVAGLFEGANTSFDGYPVSSAGQWDGYVWHLTGNGDNRGVARLGSATGDQFNDIAIDADKNIWQ